MTKEKIIEIIKNELECVRTASDNKCDRDCENCKLVRDSDDIIKAYNFVIEMLEKESCDNCVSRQAIVGYLCTHCPDDAECLEDCEDIKNIKALLSATPQPKTGHWIKIEPYPMMEHEYKCSECYNGTDNPFEKYCSECGAKMVEVEE